jgi:RNA polymerase sigma factor (sigma-70 family)
MADRICGPANGGDALNQAYVRALERRVTFDPIVGELSAWFTRIVANCAISIVRGDCRHVQRTTHDNPDEVDPSFLSTAPPVSALEVLVTRQTNASVRAALAELSERDRHILLQHYEAGFSFVEIATELGLTANVVSSCATRALNRLERRPDLLALRSEIANGGRR